jgi:hypothetical protein
MIHQVRRRAGSGKEGSRGVIVDDAMGDATRETASEGQRGLVLIG